MANPNNFSKHRMLMTELKGAVAALAAGYPLMKTEDAPLFKDTIQTLSPD
jgi:hypothetical protein